MNTASNELISYIQTQCDKLWIDENMRTKLTNIVNDGIQYLDSIYGADGDYSKQGIFRALLVNYVQYTLANALDDFSKNYAGELIGLHLKGCADNGIETEDEP